MGDIRLDRLNERLYERVVESGSLVLKTLGGRRKDEVAAGRFLANDAVDPELILGPTSPARRPQRSAARSWSRKTRLR
jgi:hypothetical protein